MWIEEPGLYHIEADEYFADPCPMPSLNNSLIGDLVDCPKLAWEGHPRLNPAYVPKTPSPKMILGSIVHRLVLGAGREFEVIDATSYRSGDARDAKAAALAGGKIPVLPAQRDAAEAMARALAVQLESYPDTHGNPFDLSNGKSEIALLWRDEIVWCRSLIDRLRNDLPIWELWDLKFTEANINPESAGLGIHFVEMGYDTQCAMQERGLIALFPQLAGRIRFRVLFQQTDEPYLISVVEPDAATMTMARKKVDYAIRRWSDCITTGIWPGYPARVVPLRHAEFLAARWLEREVRESEAGEFPEPPAPALKRRPGRPRKPKPNHPLKSLAGG